MIRHLYVYALIDPRDGSVFYIGKGAGRRMYEHQLAVKRNSKGLTNPAKVAHIREILAAGLNVQPQMLACCTTDEDAYEVERQLIAEYSHHGLLNANVGGGGSKLGHVKRESVLDPFTTARRLFASIQPFSDWLRRAARSNEDVRIYWFVHDSLMDVMKLCRPRS